MKSLSASVYVLIFACFSGSATSVFADASFSDPTAPDQKASGIACPVFASSYNCSLTAEETQAGKTDYRLGIAQSHNKDGQPVLNLGGAEFITDGEVHERAGHGSTVVKYMVGCQGQSVLVNVAGSEGQSLKTELSVSSDRRILHFKATGTSGGPAKTEDRNCTSL